LAFVDILRDGSIFKRLWGILIGSIFSFSDLFAKEVTND
jgi:hypothetical protein